MYNRGMPADMPLQELASNGPEGRKQALTIVLERRAMFMAEGRRFTWADVLAGLTLGGQQVSLYQVKHWLKSDWGQELWLTWQTNAIEAARDLLDGQFVPALQQQLTDSLNTGLKPADRALAYANVLRTAKEIGYLDDLAKDADGRRPDINLLVKVYAEPIQLVRNITPAPQSPKLLTEPTITAPVTPDYEDGHDGPGETANEVL